LNRTGVFWLGYTFYLARLLLFFVMLLFQTQRYTTGLVYIFYGRPFFASLFNVNRNILVYYIKQFQLAAMLLFGCDVKQFEWIRERSYGFRGICRPKIGIYISSAPKTKLLHEEWAVNHSLICNTSEEWITPSTVTWRVGSESLYCNKKSGEWIVRVLQSEWISQLLQWESGVNNVFGWRVGKWITQVLHEEWGESVDCNVKSGE
jgi:hypothetical protein